MGIIRLPQLLYKIDACSSGTSPCLPWDNSQLKPKKRRWIKAAQPTPTTRFDRVFMSRRLLLNELIIQHGTTKYTQTQESTRLCSKVTSFTFTNTYPARAIRTMLMICCSNNRLNSNTTNSIQYLL